MAKKGCSKKFVQLKPMATTSSTSTTPRPATVASSSGSATSARSPKQVQSSGPAAAASPGKKQTQATASAADPDLMAARVGSTFRAPGGTGTNTKATKEVVIDPRSGKALPLDWEVGKIVAGISCPVCSHGMVLRVIAESVCLAVATYHHFVLLAQDVKNAYFSGKSVGREVYLEPPRGGLPGVRPGQLLRAKKAIYGFSEAARLFWLALKEHLESDGWCESRLEPALFYLRRGGQLLGILVTHVDDLEGGLHHTVLESAFSKTQQVLEFSTNHFKSFIFRGREIQQTAQNHVDVSMRNYALRLKPVKIDADRRKHLRAPLTAEEKEVFQSSAGELGWLARQLRCDLAYENGVVQRSKSETCVADFLLLKQFVGQAKRGADFKQRYWSDVNLRDGVVLHLADSGHANGAPDHKEELRSVGGYFILIANKEILEGKPARASVLAYHSTLTKWVCRSTLAAEASHLAEAVEAGDWIIVLLEEALTGDIDLRNWPEVIRQRRRAYITERQVGVRLSSERFYFVK